MYFTDNPIADFLRYDSEQTEELEKYPECCICGDHITDDCYYDIDGEIYCERCMNHEFRISN
jgi:hypothetical protein